MVSTQAQHAMCGVRARLQIEVIRDVMLSAAECARSFGVPHGGWMTLREIAELTAYAEASVSAQLRRLRKPRFGGFTVEKRRRSSSEIQWEYRIPGRSENSFAEEIFRGMRAM
ncbi:MAG TPA: hypothetical protein VFO34_13445 [Candidatus Acidoferrales bacterium]|nr:hypothetical protein [Candidatus Acidoferrales bacterium]